MADESEGSTTRSNKRSIASMDESFHVYPQEFNEEPPYEMKKQHLCADCGKVYKTWSGLYRNRRLKHLDKAKHTYVICDKTFMEKDPYGAHVNKHQHTTPHRCATCMKKFASRVSKTHHEKMCTDNSASYTCTQCQQKFTCRDILQDHVKGTHGREYRDACSICGASYKWRASLAKHRKSQHP